MAVSRTRGRTEQYAKPRYDSYVGLLVVSFVALLGGAILLYLDYDEYGQQPPPPMPDLSPAPTAGQPPVQPGGGGGGPTPPGLGMLPPATEEPQLASDMAPAPIEPDRFHWVSVEESD